jgi:hypothetical protein
MPQVYSLYTKNVGDSPDIWVLIKTVESRQKVAAEVLYLLDKTNPNQSFAFVRES